MPHYLTIFGRAIIRPMERSRFVIILGTLAVLVLGGISLSQLLQEKALPPPPESLSTVLLPEYRAVTPFQLTDGDSQPFDLSRLKGEWSFIFFGYTHCPDICPTTLAMLRLFISVDPKRDKPANLKQFVSYFHPDFLTATGEKAEIDNLAKQLGAVYMFDGDTNSDDYIVNHSATVVLIDPQGRWVARFNPPHKASEIAEQFRRVRDYFQQK
jgi:protein SCO1/2